MIFFLASSPCAEHAHSSSPRNAGRQVDIFHARVASSTRSSLKWGRETRSGGVSREYSRTASFRKPIITYTRRRSQGNRTFSLPTLYSMAKFRSSAILSLFVSFFSSLERNLSISIKRPWYAHTRLCIFLPTLFPWCIVKISSVRTEKHSPVFVTSLPVAWSYGILLIIFSLSRRPGGTA